VIAWACRKRGNDPGSVGFVAIFASLFMGYGGMATTTIGAVLYIVAAVFGVLAVAINSSAKTLLDVQVGSDVLYGKAKQGYSFALAVVGLGFYIIGAILAICAGRNGGGSSGGGGGGGGREGQPMSSNTDTL